MTKAVPVAILLAFLLLVYLAMWRGWRRRGRKHDLPALEVPTDVDPALLGTGRYFGTAVAGDWLDRVVAQGLGNRSDCTLALSDLGMDVQRPGLASFRIPVAELEGASRESGISGKVIPPHGVLVVTWRHGDLTLESGFRLRQGDHERWAEAIDKLVKEHA